MFELILFYLVALCAAVIIFCRFIMPALAKRDPEPWYLDYARSFFPVLLIVFLLRGFIAEPFRIPSGSMLPTLEIGDFILVNKYQYGIRLPILHTKIIEVGSPKRGDIMVFRFPKDRKINFIKRVIGLPGDVVEYRNKVLYLNGKAVDEQSAGEYTPFASNPRRARPLDMFVQTIATSEGEEMQSFSILKDKFQGAKFNRQYRVPEGHYLMMGDNRDNSHDGRAWGFVPEENIVGKAFFIWFHYNPMKNGGFKFSRIGDDI